MGRHSVMDTALMGEEGHAHSHKGGALSWRGACAQGGGHTRGEAHTLMGEGVLMGRADGSGGM